MASFLICYPSRDMHYWDIGESLLNSSEQFDVKTLMSRDLKVRTGNITHYFLSVKLDLQTALWNKIGYMVNNIYLYKHFLKL